MPKLYGKMYTEEQIKNYNTDKSKNKFYHYCMTGIESENSIIDYSYWREVSEDEYVDLFYNEITPKDSIEQSTCNFCSKKSSCKFAFDKYNIQGECLAEK